MASANESPRQKMIGMMYLVLTAMLALQVSSALLDKFIMLNNSLELANGAANTANDRQVISIKEAVAKLPNPAQYVDVIAKAQETRKITSEMVSEIEDLKQEIIKISGGTDEKGALKNPTEEEKIAILMMGGAKNGKAYSLRSKINALVEKLGKIGETKLEPLARDGKDDPISKLNPEQKNKDFAELNFAQTPVPAALAVLSQKQSELRRYEANVLGILAQKVGAKEIKFDNIFGMISAKSMTVVAGMTYEAQMFIAASSSGITPRMTLDGQSLPVNDGRAQIKFTAQGGSYDSKGMVRKVLQGNIAYPNPAGGMKNISVEQEYFVVKPDYHIETGTLPPMYLGCANKLSVQSRSLGSLWNPTFTAEGGEVISSGDKGKITVVPSAVQVQLNISNTGTLMGKETFRVRKVPKPEVVVLGNGAPIDVKRGAAASGLRYIEARAVADEGFKASNPEDARYRVQEIEVSLARGSRRVGTVTLGAGGGSLGQMAAQAQAGDRYVIEIKSVQRMNFRNTVENVAIGSSFINVPLN